MGQLHKLNHRVTSLIHGSTQLTSHMFCVPSLVHVPAVPACAVRMTRLANLPEVAGCEAKLRMEGDKPYVTDNSNYIVDLYFQVSTTTGQLFGECRRRGVWRLQPHVSTPETE